MIELVLSLVAVVLVLLFAHLGRAAGAFGALGQFFTAVVAVLVAMRAWFYASHALSALQSTSLPVLAVAVFWIIVALFGFMLLKLRETYTEVFDAVRTSWLDGLIGWLFGAGTGAILASALMLSVSIVALQFWPEYNPGKLPLALDRVPLVAYRFLEKNVARVDAHEPGHTPLPSLKPTDLQDPAVFWE